MKIEFENDKEKETLSHILLDWFMHNGDLDVLGCEPACRNPESSGCEQCIKEMIDYQLDRNNLEFWSYGGEDWILKHKVQLIPSPYNYEKAFETAQEKLEYIAERDDRNWKNRETENSSYFDGIWDALKIMQDCKMESKND